MKRHLAMTIAVLALAVAAAPALAQTTRAPRGHWGAAQVLRVQLGAFTPDGDSVYWTDKAIDFTGDADDFEDAAVAVEYLRFLGDRLGLLLSGTFYSGETAQHYLDFVDEFGGEIFHDTSLELAAFNAGLLFHLLQRDAAVSPYVGAGGGLYVWTLREVGDFIDFDRGAEIFFGDFETDGATLGYYLQAGVEVPVASSWSVYADAKWLRAEDRLDGDFEGFGDLDLSGRTISLGVAISF